jgi:hypothetical protein
MSLLADLLSKITPERPEGAIPPALERVVSDSRRRKVMRRRMAVMGGFALLIVLAGIGVVRYVTGVTGSSPGGPTAGPYPDVARKPQVEPGPSGPSYPAGREFPVARVETPVAPATGALSRKPATRRQELPVVREAPARSEPVRTRDTVTEPVESAREASDRQKAERDELLYSARNYETSKEYDHALRDYGKALGLDPRDYVVMNNMAGVLIAKGSYKEAAEYAKASLSVNREYAPSLVNLGISSIQLDRTDEGKGYLLKALALEPSNTYALLNLALLYERLKDYDEARRLYSRLHELREIRGVLGTARVAEKMGKPDDARRTYREILAMDGVDAGTKRLASERLAALEGK